MKLQFFGQSSRSAQNPAAASVRLVNMYREPTVGGRSGFVMRSVLGLEPFATLGDFPIRAFVQSGGVGYLAAGAMLWSVDGSGGVSSLGAIEDDENTTISANGSTITVCAAGRYWTWDGTTLAEPTPGDITVFQSIDYFGYYTVLTERDGVKWCWSDPADPTSLPGLNVTAATTHDGNIIRSIVAGANLWIFKAGSMEAFALTGLPGAEAFTRIDGTAAEIGLKGFRLVCKIPNGAFFVGSNGRAYILDAGLSEVSTPPVLSAIEHMQPEACMYYEDQGHGFCCITFRDAPAWCYDVTTQEWHERASGDGPWTVEATAKIGASYYAARSLGDVLRFSRTNADGDDALVRVATSATMADDGRRFKLAELEIFGRTGRDEGRIGLTISGDNGQTWGAERVESLPAVGDYSRRILWRSLGQFRQVTARLTISDPVDVSIDTDGRVRTA